MCVLCGCCAITEADIVSENTMVAIVGRIRSALLNRIVDIISCCHSLRSGCESMSDNACFHPSQLFIAEQPQLSELASADGNRALSFHFPPGNPSFSQTAKYVPCQSFAQLHVLLGITQ